MSASVAAAAVTADSIRAALREHFAGEEWALVWEVANGMGAATRRWADGIAVNLWPSRGHAIHGIEIKIARNDWQRELKKPEKAEEINRHCDFWWVAAKRGVVEPNGVPDRGTACRQDGGRDASRQARARA